MNKVRIKKHRRSFLPAFLFALLLWLLLILLVVSFTPETNLLVVGFYSLFFLACFFTFSLLFGHSRRGLIFALAAIAFLFLNQIRQAHFLNFILFGGLLLSIELYFSRH